MGEEVVMVWCIVWFIVLWFGLVVMWYLTAVRTSLGFGEF